MKEENEQKLNFWEHVSKSIQSFNHEVFINNNKESSSTEQSLSDNNYVSKSFKRTASIYSPKGTPILCKTIQKNAYYKDQSLKTHPACNLKDLNLRTVSVDLSCSHCNFVSKDALKAAACICQNCKCKKYCKNQQKFKLKSLSVVLSDVEIDKTGFDNKDSSNNRALEKHKLYPGFKPLGKFHNSMKKEDLFTSNVHKLYLPDLQLFANKIPEKNPIIKLHPIEKTIAFCKNLNLQPVWKNSELWKSPVKLKNKSKLKTERFNRSKSVH